jgi:putative DNA primase/helicase
MVRKNNGPKEPINRKKPAPLSLITIVGEGYDEWKQRYFKLKVEGSTVDLPPYSMARINKVPETLYTDLSNAGANIFAADTKRQLLKQLEDRIAEPPTFKVASHPGWHGSTLVFPDKTFGNSKLPVETSFADLDQQMMAKYRTRGTLEDWQNQIWALCVGNSRLIFALSLAAAPLVLPLVKGPRSGGFQLAGAPETGKTCAGMVAGSFWGCHRGQERRYTGFAESWNTTQNAVERTALAHNHSLLILDETKRAGRNDRDRAQNVVNMAVGLAEHTEKERLTNPGSARSFCCYFFSTSNHPLNELGEKGDIEIDDAERGRLVDLVLPAGGHGLYEDLHGFADGGKLTDELKTRSCRFFGTPRHEFAQRLAEERKRDRLRLERWLNRRRRAYLKKLQKEVKKLLAENPAAKPPLQRASARFATVYAAGALAAKYGVFPLSRKQLANAILRCQLDSLRANVVTKKAVAPNLKEKLIGYLHQHRTEFMDLDAARPALDNHKFGSVPGYAATFSGEKWLYLTADRLKTLIGTGEKASELKKELAAARLLATTKDRFVVQRPIFGGANGNKGFRSVHAFKASLLDNNVIGQFPPAGGAQSNRRPDEHYSRT